MRQLASRRSLGFACLGLLVLPAPWLAPGLLLAHLLRRGRGDGIDGLTRLPLALALPVVLLPWLRLLELPWQRAWWVLAAISLVILVLSMARGPERRWPPAAASWLLAAVAVYVAPHVHLPAPSGVDMGMHLAFARLLRDLTVIPSTLDPFLPGVPFGVYPLGFHGLTALVSGLWGDLGRSGLATAALVQAFVPVAIYLTLRRGPGLDRWALMAAVLVVWLARAPQNYVGWGGNPYALGVAFALVALRRLLDALDRPDRRLWVEAMLLALATAMTHPTAAALTIYGGLGLLAWHLATRRDLGRRHLTTLVPALVAGLVLVVPLIPQLGRLDLVHAELAVIVADLKTPPQAPQPGLGGALRHLVGQFGDTVLVVVAVLGLWRARVDRGRSLLIALVGLVSAEVLAFLALQPWLPLYVMIAPDRIMPVILPLLAWPVVAWLRDWRGGPWRRAARVVDVMLLVALVSLAASRHLHYYHGGLRDGQIVTAEDRQALAWLEEHGQAGDLVSTNYFDAGQFVPALAGLPCSQPQLNPLWRNEARRALATLRPTWVMIGARTWAGREAPLAAPAHPPAFQAGRGERKARIWRLDLATPDATDPERSP